jgi:acetone carboxylase gamma subunit
LVTIRSTSAQKDPRRFETYIELLEERVPSDDKIILPLGPKLYIVQKATTPQWVARCKCGHDFCDWRENWKPHAFVSVRDTPEALEEIDPRLMAPTPSWQVIRAFYCPECGTLHDVEAPTPWYPIIRDFEPHIDTFYRDWLGAADP